MGYLLDLHLVQEIYMITQKLLKDTIKRTWNNLIIYAQNLNYIYSNNYIIINI